MEQELKKHIHKEGYVTENKEQFIQKRGFNQTESKSFLEKGKSTHFNVMK